MSNWVGGLPPGPKAKEKSKKASRPTSPPDGDHPKTFFGGAIPPIPPKHSKYKKNDVPPSKVILTGAGRPIQQEAPESKQAAPKLKQEAAPKPKQEAPSKPKQGAAPEQEAPSVSRPATPPTPSLPQPPPPSPVSEATPQSYTPPPPPSPVSEPAPESYTPSPPPKRFPSVFDTKPKKKRKKSKKKPPPPPPPPPPAPKPMECDDDDVCGDQGEANLGKLASIFAICYIPATCQDDSSYSVEEEMATSGYTSPRSGASDDVDDGPDIPPEVPSYMRSNKFAGVFGKKIDARNVVELDPQGWHPSANAPDDPTDDTDNNIVSDDASANAPEDIPDTGNTVSDDPGEPRNTGDHSIAQEIKQGHAPELVKLATVSASPDLQKHERADSKCGIM